MRVINFRKSIFYSCVTVASLVFALGAQAQEVPDMHGHPRMEQMRQKFEQHRQLHLEQLKAKLDLKPEQQAAWDRFVQLHSVSEKRDTPPMDRAAWSKLTTPERLDQWATQLETRQTAQKARMRETAEGIKQFYGQLAVDQKKIFDEQTIPHFMK